MAKPFADFIVPFDTLPMEAKIAETLPAGDGWQYEPKWDGFRCLAFRDGNAVELHGKSGKSLTRYFPDVVQLSSQFPQTVSCWTENLRSRSGKSFPSMHCSCG